MSNKNLFKEAIADAKAVREAALANAKAALEEALTPKLQSMLAAKLNEMEDNMDEYAYEDGEMEEGFTSSHEENADANLDFNLEEEMEDDSMDEDFDLSEILAELEDENLNEAKKEEEDKKKKKKMMKEAEEEEEEEEEEETEEESEDVADMSVEDLKALIKDIVAQEMGDEEGGKEAGEEMEMGGEEEESDEINLDELLAELDALGEGEDKKDMEEGIIDTLKGARNWLSAKVYGISKSDVEACRNSSKTRSEYMECIQSKGGAFTSAGTGAVVGGMGQSGEKSSDLREAIATINTLRSELNEVNLLNAKLLYVNKIFKAKNLSESQKLQVIASFDKATTAKEAKVVFESLNYTLTTAAPKQAIKESLGFASRAVGVAPRKAIVESNDVITRMQKLANIIK
jgi:hypothetical protein